VAPGFQKYLSDYATMSKPIDEQNYLQGLKIADVDGTITLNRVQNALDKIDKARSQPGANDAKSISDATLQQLTALRDDLARAKNIDLGKARGSPTDQNLIAGNLAAESGVPLAALSALSGHPKVAAATGLGKLLFGAKSKQATDQLAQRLLYPGNGPAPVATTQGNKITGVVRKALTPSAPAVGALLANRMLGQTQ
jgi:hypothetical protein